MDPLIKQISETFHDIQNSDIQRILDFLGYSTEDITQPNPPYRLINGESIFIPEKVVQDDIERSTVKTVQIKLSIDVVKDHGTEVVFT